MSLGPDTYQTFTAGERVTLRNAGWRWALEHFFDTDDIVNGLTPDRTRQLAIVVKAYFGNITPECIVVYQSTDHPDMVRITITHEGFSFDRYVFDEHLFKETTSG